jgi:uncharacterized membrane protein YfcA
VKELLLGLMAGLMISVVTTPVGVSGAVFLGVPNPAVTPTNLLFNVVSGPGALLRYGRRGALLGPLTRLLLLGTLPGVVLGAVTRVFVVPGPQVFRLIVALLLLPLGLWLCIGKQSKGTGKAPPGRRGVVASAFAVGVVGGIYGIGGGSILGPVLVGRGMPVATVAPAALASTFVTSIAGAGTFAVLALSGRENTAPEWGIGIMCGIGGLIGGYLGAHLQPRIPERALRLVLGLLAVGVAVLYAGQVLI